MRWIALQAFSIESDAGGAGQSKSSDAAQQAICAIALGFTPRVALCGNAVVMEVSGSLRLFGGLFKLAELLEANLHAFFKKNSLSAQIIRAQAATSLVALGRLQLLRTGHNLPARIADMPMHTLAATHPHLAVLERTGCRTWGDLLGLPRDGVARRFGAPLLTALDQAKGAMPEPYRWCVLPDQFEQKIELDALVIHAPGLMSGVDVLLMQLHAWLLGRQSGLCALKVIWHLDKRRDVLPTGELTVRTAQPAQDLQHVVRLIAERLNQESLSAPVHSITLLSLETVSLHDAASSTASLLVESRQLGVSHTQFIERLRARLGPASVLLWQPRANHRPEEMQDWVDASKDSDHYASKSIASSARNNSSKGSKHTKKEFKAIHTDALYPTWLLPQPLKLTSRSGAPVYQGPLVKLVGPQRLEAAGWLMAEKSDIDPALRDYFIYRSSQGTLLWIYSERLVMANSDDVQNHVQREWYLQGVFA